MYSHTTQVLPPGEVSLPILPYAAPLFVSTLLHEGVDKNTVADLAGHGDTSFLERTYCHPQMQRKQDAAKRMSECLIPTRSAAQMVS